MDETTVQVHREAGKEDSSTSYMWVVRGGEPSKPLIHYMYHSSRRGSIPHAYLCGYDGSLQVDGYAGYDRAVKEHNLIRIGCLAHVRRKFFECSKLSKGSKASLAVLGKIKAIYAAEERLQQQDLSDEQLVANRLENILPLLTKLQQYLEQKSLVVLPSSAFGKAVAYALEQLPKIKQYAGVPCASLDNNATERCIRSFVIGRSNWQFADTPSGAHASAAWYSLIESAKSARLDPAVYITYVLDHLNEVERSQQWESLLPEHVQLN
jgi:transposase